MNLRHRLIPLVVGALMATSFATRAQSVPTAPAPTAPTKPSSLKQQAHDRAVQAAEAAQQQSRDAANRVAGRAPYDPTANSQGMQKSGLAASSVEESWRARGTDPSIPVPALNWTKVQSELRFNDIATSPNGSVYALGMPPSAKPDPLGSRIRKWNPQRQQWDTLPGLARQIAVGNDGELWALNGQGSLFRSSNDGGTWKEDLNGVLDVSAGADVWVNLKGLIEYFAPQTAKWRDVSQSLPVGNIKRVVAGGIVGRSFLIAADGGVWARLHQSASYKWHKLQAPSLQDLSRDANGRLWGVSVEAAPNGAGNYKLVMRTADYTTVPAPNGTIVVTDTPDPLLGPKAGVWVSVPGSAIKLAADNNRLWALTAAGELFVTPLPAP